MNWRKLTQFKRPRITIRQSSFIRLRIKHYRKTHLPKCLPRFDSKRRVIYLFHAVLLVAIFNTIFYALCTGNFGALTKNHHVGLLICLFSNLNLILVTLFGTFILMDHVTLDEDEEIFNDNIPRLSLITAISGILIILVISFVALGLFHSSMDVGQIENYVLLESYEKDREIPGIMDQIQIEQKCCGIRHGVWDYTKIIKNSFTSINLFIEKIPPSCCKKNQCYNKAEIEEHNRDESNFDDDDDYIKDLLENGIIHKHGCFENSSQSPEVSLERGAPWVYKKMKFYHYSPLLWIIFLETPLLAILLWYCCRARRRSNPSGGKIEERGGGQSNKSGSYAASSSDSSGFTMSTMGDSESSTLEKSHPKKSSLENLMVWPPSTDEIGTGEQERSQVGPTDELLEMIANVELENEMRHHSLVSEPQDNRTINNHKGEQSLLSSEFPGGGKGKVLKELSELEASEKFENEEERPKSKDDSSIPDSDES